MLAATVGQAAGLPAIAWSPVTSPGTFDYGTIPVGDGESQTFALTNSGRAATGALRVSLGSATEFSITADACTGTALGPRKSCNVTVQYAPTTAGQTTATLAANGIRPPAGASITLAGTGAAVAVRHIYWANSGTNWGVNANHPNTGGIKSYPNAKKVIGKSITSLGSLKSSYNVTVPSSGAYNTSYDIWDTNYDYEIMLWVNKTGAVGPLGTSQGSLTLGGSTWTVYKGNNGANDVFSFVRSSNSTSGTIDVLPILKWIKDTKGWFGNVTIGDLQFGFEITSSSGGLDFTTNSESVTSS